MNPKLVIDQNALLQNMNTIYALARRQGVKLSIVTKGLVGHEPLVRLLVDNGASSVCEARIGTLKKWEKYPAEKWLIRSPLISEAEDVARYADVSLVTEKSVLEALSEAADDRDSIHKVIIMLELGELREGCMPDELLPLCKTVQELPGLELHGIGTHLSSTHEIVPDEQNMKALADAAEEIEKALDITLPIVSGGSSSALKMLAEGQLPKKINHLRIGEAVLLGNIVCYDIPYDDARTDVFKLNAEIIEVKEKPSLPWGLRADGAPPVPAGNGQQAAGLRKRALVALGKQDVSASYLVPFDKGIKILGDTSDCFIADVTDSENEYKPGDTLSFRLKYNGLVSAMASDYVDKILA